MPLSKEKMREYQKVRRAVIDKGKDLFPPCGGCLKLQAENNALKKIIKTKDEAFALVKNLPKKSSVPHHIACKCLSCRPLLGGSNARS